MTCIKICLTTFWKGNSRKLFVCHFRTHSRPQNSNICTNNQLISSQNAILTNKMNRSIQDHIRMTIFSDLTPYIRYCKIQAVLYGNTDSKINKKKKEIFCQLGILISVYLWREGERTVRETHFFKHLCHVTCVTVFQPTEIRTNTGSVSYPKVKSKIKIYQKARTRAREYRDHSE